MTLYVRESLSVLPSAFSVSLRDILDTSGPFFISYAYWVAVTDAGAGTFAVNLNWTDPAGVARSVAGPALNLATAGAGQVVNPFIVKGQSGASPMAFVSTYAGTPGAARYGFTLAITSAAAADITYWG
jgi:hypothetical protein